MAVVGLGGGAGDEAVVGGRYWWLVGMGLREGVNGEGEQGDLPEFHDVCSGEDALDRPAGEFAAVVLHLRSYYRASLAC